MQSSPYTQLNSFAATCPGVTVVAGSHSNDPVHNLLAYAGRHLDEHLRDEIGSLVDAFITGLQKPAPLVLQFNTIIPRIPLPHRAQIEALLRDLEVLFLDRRYNLLRMVVQTAPSYGELVGLLDTYCLGQSWASDPEIPRIAARVVIRHLSQWQLMCLLHDKMRRPLDALAEATSINDIDIKRTFAWLGRLMLFLRWTPYNWTEEILLEILDRIRLAGTIDETRLCTSVLRSFFCRSTVSITAIERLGENIFARFQGKLPNSLLPLLRAILISGGNECRLFLERQLDEHPERYRTSWFLEVMSALDKAATARLLCNKSESLLTAIDKVSFINLLAETGESDGMVSDMLLSLWDDNDARVKIAVLQAIDKLRCSRACAFLVDALLHEQDTQLQLVMLDTIADSGSFDALRRLPRKLAQGHPVIYFHSIDLCHRRLLANPVLLTRLKSYSLFRHFEAARIRIYALYRFLHAFRDLIESNRTLVREVANRNGTIAYGVASFIPEVNAHGAAHNHVHIPPMLQAVLDKIFNLSTSHFRNIALSTEMSAILDFAPYFNPRYSDDVFGQSSAQFARQKVLHQADFTGMPSVVIGVEETAKVLDDLLVRSANSLIMIQEYFLFKEWFIRKAPFLLHDGISAVIETIRRGEELQFSPDAFRQEAVTNRHREIFHIFYECTKQGVYLTDRLLDYLKKWPGPTIPGHVWKDLTHRRAEIAREEKVYDPHNDFERHLQFTTFAHRYRYGKESVDRPSITYLWLKFELASTQLINQVQANTWPDLPPHPQMRATIGPLVKNRYQQQIDEAANLFAFIEQVYERYHPRGIRIRIIPNITYGLFCLAPIVMNIVRKGIHVSLAGISSRYCDDMNISEFKLGRDALFPVKPYPFSTASNYGTLNHDRILIVIDGTMEPLHRQCPRYVRLPMAHRGYLNHIAAVNYVRSKYGYGMDDPCRDVASALGLSARYIRNLARTATFAQTVENLLQNFDKHELQRFHRATGAGRTYYTFAQWNQDGLSAQTGARGYTQRIIPCATPHNITSPTLLFVSMNGFTQKAQIPAFFDNNPEVEKSRIVIGPYGVNLDTGWPAKGKGSVVQFPEGENR
ncbi:MAG: hypothetical protein GF398_03685 [Chitinivibrionales bacterium]|nr:hypothetical protein [Chitinivibrionales bacterium]